MKTILRIMTAGFVVLMALGLTITPTRPATGADGKELYKQRIRGGEAVRGPRRDRFP